MKRAVLWVAGFLACLCLTTPARADEIDSFIKDNARAILTHSSRMEVVGKEVPVIANIAECYAAATVAKIMIEAHVPQAKPVADKMIKCKASIGEAVVDVAAADVKHGPAILSIMKQGQDVEERVLRALAKDIGKEVVHVGPALKAEENAIIKAVTDEVLHWGLTEAKKAAAYVEQKTREDEQAAAAAADMLPNGVKKELRKAYNETCKGGAGKAAANMAKKDWSRLRRLF
jgi:hypothetical protein